MLHILAMDYVKSGRGIGQVMEFTGPGLKALDIDERATLTNMAVEAGGFTGIVEADEMTVDYLVDARAVSSARAVEAMLVKADPDAEYAEVFTIDLAALEPMVATPARPAQRHPALARSGGKVKLDIAYGGSCTGGKMADMDMYAAVLSAASPRGAARRRRATKFYIQFGSRAHQGVRARARAIIEVFEQAGAELLDPACGACIRAGPGARIARTRSSSRRQNRNFPGRSRPGPDVPREPVHGRRVGARGSPRAGACGSLSIGCCGSPQP